MRKEALKFRAQNKLVSVFIINEFIDLVEYISLIRKKQDIKSDVMLTQTWCGVGLVLF